MKKGFIYKGKNKAFTLIELLVVIAIITILASAALVSLNSARSKAKDTRIISGLSQVRSAAEILSDSNGNYSTLTPTNTAIVNIDKVRQDISDMGGTLNIVLGANSNGYIAYSNLASDTASYYCVDSSGDAKKYPSAPAWPDAGTSGITCP